MKKRISIIIILIAALFSLSIAFNPPMHTNMSFTAHGFGYVKIKNIKTGKFMFLFSNGIINHCCGDLTQQNNVVLNINKAAGEYIAEHMDAPANQFKLLPTFSKCFNDGDQAEEIRAKKIKYFKSLHYEVVEIDMNLTAAAPCN